MNWAEFFHMSGYAIYVWSAWGLTAVVLLWQWAGPKRRHTTLRREIKRQLNREKQFTRNDS